MGTDFIYYTASSISVVSKNCQNCCNKGKSFSTVIFFCNSLAILHTVINHSNSTYSRRTKITVVLFRHEKLWFGALKVSKSNCHFYMEVGPSCSLTGYFILCHHLSKPYINVDNSAISNTQEKCVQDICWGGKLKDNIKESCFWFDC